MKDSHVLHDKACVCMISCPVALADSGSLRLYAFLADFG